MLNIKFKCNIINIMDPYSAANTRKNPYDNQYSDYFNNVYDYMSLQSESPNAFSKFNNISDYLSLQSETSNRFPKHREIKIVPTNVDKQKVQKMDDKVPSLLDFGNTKGLDFGNTKGLDFGNTKGLDFGNQKILPKRSQLYDNFTDKKMNIKNIINNSKTEYPFCN